MINILSKETIDKIAAGEVAERPESVVKELLDNAVDSGSSAVSIEIRGGGLDLIRVTDNGCGIDREDIPVAFVRHATSKLKTADDIEHVCTMGFRGEALASIAAVSDVEMISKVHSELTGTLYRIEAGFEKANKEIGAPDGTTVAVRNFLYNVPVRLQFLKSPQTENSYIITTVENIALAHPDISISLTIDGRSILHTSGNGRMKDIIYILHGAETASNLIELSYEHKGVTVTGFIAKPVINRSRRDLELFFVNGRCIRSDILKKAVEDGYAPFMMQHRFPMVFINIDIKPEAVDVNVHPRKTEVRFSDNKLMYDAVYEAVTDALSKKELIVDAGAALKYQNKPAMHAYSVTNEKSIAAEKSFKVEPYEVQRKFDYVSSVEELINGNSQENASAFSDDTSSENAAVAAVKEHGFAGTPAKEHAFAELIDTGTDTGNRASSEAFLNKKNVPYFKLIGQVFETYWIIEYNDEMFIIDQHAAHEKVNYERFTALINNNEVTSQMLFPPIVLTLTAREALQLDKNIELFAEAGYEIEYAGDKDYVVRAVPANLPGVGEYELLKDIIENTFDESNSLSSELLKNKIASMSCKAAVKGNNKLSEPEIKALIGELLTLDNPYACPHGRPTIVKWSRGDLDKLFKRIV